MRTLRAKTYCFPSDLFDQIFLFQNHISFERIDRFWWTKYCKNLKSLFITTLPHGTVRVQVCIWILYQRFKIIQTLPKSFKSDWWLKKWAIMSFEQGSYVSPNVFLQHEFHEKINKKRLNHFLVLFHFKSSAIIRTTFTLSNRPNSRYRHRHCRYH